VSIKSFPDYKYLLRENYVEYKHTVPDITNLKARKTDAFATITEDMLENTWRDTDYRLDVLRATKGAHVEVY
jgi:hypothetical protein